MATELWQRIKFARTHAKLTQDQVADRLGISRAAVAQWEAIDPEKRTTPSRLNLLRFSDASGAPIEWLNDDRAELDATLWKSAPHASSITANETATDYVRAIDIGAEGGMGDARINDDFPEVIRAVDYTQQYIRGLVGFVPPPGRLVLFTGRGDSMMPTIQPGESLLVDTGVTSFDRDGIYLVNLGHGQQIKRLVDHGEEAGVHVHSDNPAYPTIRWPKGGVIGGKVYLRNRTDRLD